MFSKFFKRFRKSEPEQNVPETQPEHIQEQLPAEPLIDSSKEAVVQEVVAEATLPVENIAIEPKEAPIVIHDVEVAEPIVEPVVAPEVSDTVSPSVTALSFDTLDNQPQSVVVTEPVVMAQVTPESVALIAQEPAQKAVETVTAPEAAVLPQSEVLTESGLEAPVPLVSAAVEIATIPEEVVMVVPAEETISADEAEKPAALVEDAQPAVQGWARGIVPTKVENVAATVEPIALAEVQDIAVTTQEAVAVVVEETVPVSSESSFFTGNWATNVVEVEEAIIETIAPTTAPVVKPVHSNPVSNFEPNESVSSWTARLKQGLSKSRDKLGKSLAGVFGGAQIDEDLYEELEDVLLTSDMGVAATEHLLKEVRERVSLKGLKDPQELREALKDALVELIEPLQQPLEIPADAKPFVIMMTGVNGAGKTTSIGKLATHYQRQDKSVLLAAGDTFRAAAREQLIEWGARNNVTVISQATGDSAAVCFDAMHAAQARGTDIVLADTAGRLPTQLHLMEEIKKVKRVMQKSMDTAPHEIILVLDANIGQNAINQVIAFDDALGLTGLILTKLDGTAKGGVIAALAKTRPIPIRFIGVGEGIEDLRPFNARDYAEALLGD
ncbi:signal recognition particle receptor FtsY [Vitreoscilla sp. C1]|uniref:signal recognition particle-docking protein FtsY n=1 Tax=Vitreoscilla sp. (strain C1) TaxID=96942 RepID=UPI00148E9201|nr:signal recognition particle receptor FtsY [Vitreoscilla sp. C1]